MLRSFLKCPKPPLCSPSGFANYEDGSKLWPVEGARRPIFVADPPNEPFCARNYASRPLLLIRGRFAPCLFLESIPHFFLLGGLPSLAYDAMYFAFPDHRPCPFLEATETLFRASWSVQSLRLAPPAVLQTMKMRQSYGQLKVPDATYL